MVFSSTIFLFGFLPAAIITYYVHRSLLRNKPGNAILLVFSYVYYLYGAAGFLLILMLSTLADYLLGLLIDRDVRHKHMWLSLSVFLNIGLLAYFKYANFFVAEINTFLVNWGITSVEWTKVALPIGISFFTFQKLSYTIDVYRGKSRPLENILDFALYVAMFPQLIAGPIVRYSYIRDQLIQRQESWNMFYNGILRFCWGLAKKVLIAGACGQIADAVFGLDPKLLDTKTAWLGAIAREPGRVGRRLAARTP